MAAFCCCIWMLLLNVTTQQEEVQTNFLNLMQMFFLHLKLLFGNRQASCIALYCICNCTDWHHPTNYSYNYTTNSSNVCQTRIKRQDQETTSMHVLCLCSYECHVHILGTVMCKTHAEVRGLFFWWKHRLGEWIIKGQEKIAAVTSLSHTDIFCCCWN